MLRSKKKKEKFRHFLLYLFLVPSSILMCLPFIWMVSASLKPEVDVFEFPIRWIPERFRLENYTDVWTKIPFLTYYRNTIIIAVAATLLQIITCSMAAYAFSKISFPERDKLFLAYLATMMVPFQVIMIPQFIITKQLHLVNSLWSVILIGGFSTFGVFLFRQFFLTVPESISEAARIDGCSEFGIFWRIMMPLSRPAIASLTIFTFVGKWNDFSGPLIYLNTDNVKTLQLGMRTFQTQYNSSYALLMACAACSTLPVIVVYLLAQDQFIEGIATTGIKG